MTFVEAGALNLVATSNWGNTIQNFPIVLVSVGPMSTIAFIIVMSSTALHPWRLLRHQVLTGLIDGDDHGDDDEDADDDDVLCFGDGNDDGWQWR